MMKDGRTCLDLWECWGTNPNVRCWLLGPSICVAKWGPPRLAPPTDQRRTAEGPSLHVRASVVSRSPHSVIQEEMWRQCPPLFQA